MRAIEEQGQQERQRARDREADATRRAKRYHVAVGSEVQMPDGGFAGLTGIVEGGDGKFALVCFGGKMRVKVASFLLATNEV
ncbi:hypothetical protein FHS99_000752 [Sphingomonas prati]|uniref:KOW domain-containing protein n=1 Tax=Sphingomonas prati TaxID=1843237 RepID=A0A7W9F0E0_9SPHN|nr:hypothetical protein [Sphingomonas prati]MBB5728282.1 hypothetical protein [Sphingomonas prati]